MRYAQHITVGEQQMGLAPLIAGGCFWGGGGSKKGVKWGLEGLILLLYSYWGRK